MDSKKVVQTTGSVTGTPSQPLQQYHHHQQQQQQPQQQSQPQLQQQQQQQPIQQPRNKSDGPSLSGVRRRSGPHQGLRSPAAKRPVSAPVALQGWLHKQGSEGLMLWKKRWFVLSEYCLFYYKGPEEEKLLGSILLPSYRITVCRPEDKVNKKFAFKAEHANMRTYHFAADTRESMNQWVNALTLASLLQDPNPGGGENNASDGANQGAGDGDRSARPSVSSISSIMNQSADDSDSGFHGFQSRDDPSHASNNNSSPNSVNTGSFPGSSGNNSSSTNAANSNSANNNPNSITANNNSNSNNNNNSVNSNLPMHEQQQQQQQPMVNGWMHQQSPQYRHHPDGVMNQQSPVQYNHQMMPGVLQQQPVSHPHQHQPVLYQQHPHLAQQQLIQAHKHGMAQQQSPQQQQLQGTGNVQTVQPMPRNYGQPLYANAPPKPRRLNENPNDYSTPSPDPDYRKSPVSPDVRLSSKSPISVVEYVDARNPNAIYGQRIPLQQVQTQPQQPQVPRTDKSGLNYGFNQAVVQPAERRTPDTYGRSNAKPSSRQQQQRMTNGDYEDVYGAALPQLYQRPAGPVGYTKGAAPAPIPIPVYAQQHQQQQQPQVHPQYYVVGAPAANVPATRQQQQQQPKSQQPPRPHSADFLEYESNRRPNQQTPTQSGNTAGQPRCPQRPKSSLDIVNPSDIGATNDNYFYSEERYAAQMRQSAVYLHQTPQHLQQAPQQQQPVQPRNQSLSRATTPSKSSAISRDTESGIGTLSEMSCSSIRRSQRDHSHLPHPLQRHTELSTSEAAHLRRSLRETRGPALIHADHSPGRSLPRDYESAAAGGGGGGAGARAGHVSASGGGGSGGSNNSAGSRRWSEQQQFARSASARLPRNRHPAAIIDYDDDEDDYAEKSSGQDSRDGERKIQQREESMKRLLEWKQRMLQSPLTRKPSTTPSQRQQQQQQQHSSDLANCYKQQALIELAAHEAALAEQQAAVHRHTSRRREDAHHRPHHPRSKSTDARKSGAAGMAHHSVLPRYSSYSSDDEELSDVRRKRTRRPPHTGRSPRGFEKEPLHSSSSANCQPLQQQQSPPAPPISVKPQTALHRPSSRPDFGASAPLDTGYEEMSFPPSSAPKSYVNPQRPASKLDTYPVREVKPMPPRPPQTPDKLPPKKPLGILKTPGVYATSHPSGRSEASRIGTLAGYIPSETWPQAQKNVQWDSSNNDDDKEDYDSKIDESKVVKEFSYQYITQDDEKEKRERKLRPTTPAKAETVHIVKSRILSFESSKEQLSSLEKDGSEMQEPLKMSPPQATTEAQVSRLVEAPRKSSAGVIREFALGDPKAQESESSNKEAEDDTKPVMDRNKSVKDLLADFERKSQQVVQQDSENKQQKESKNRAVFSDSETLLYDTGSDFEQMEKMCNEEEEEEEEEEADQIVPKYKESASMEKSPEAQRESVKSSMDSSPLNTRSHEINVDETVNPAFTRLSVTESLVTHGDRLSGESDDASPTPKQVEDPNLEEHYLPMTPRKAILDPSSEDRPMPKMVKNLFANLREESSYVEMTQNGTSRSLLAPADNTNAGGKQDYSDYSTLDNTHYEFVCVADNKMEPVYMEVNHLQAGKEAQRNTPILKSSLKKKDSSGDVSQNTRSDLPDILTALKSDSSDADDESSKDLDSIDAPRHPRFSLSDTFRPASYYLGASQTLIAELHDSSDSELVSPPPIPTSPPPLDDLDSLEMHDSLEIKKTCPQVPHRDYNGQDDSPKSWNKPAAQVEVRRSSPSRYSDAAMNSTFHDSRVSLESASSDSVELRNPEEEARHRQLKRRPVSDDMCEVLDSLDELESLGSRFDGTSIDLDQYLEELQARDAFNVDLYTKDLSYNSIYGLNENMLVADKLQKSTYQDSSKTAAAAATSASNNSLDRPFSYGTRSKTSSASSLPSMRVSEMPPTGHQHSQSFTDDAHYENISRFSPLRSSPAAAIAAVSPRPDGEMPQQQQQQQQQGHTYRPSKTVPSPLATVVATHSRDSSYSFVSGTASVANYSAQRPASAQSSLTHSSPPMATVQSTNSYIEQRSSQPQQQQQSQYHSRSASQDSARYSLSPNHRSSSSQDSSQYPASTSTVVRIAPNPAQSDQGGAPYYYSDLQAANAESQRPEALQHPRPCTIAQTSRLPQLNNQRRDAGPNKRNDIGRIINPIVRQMPRQIQVDDIDEARRIAAELKRTTCQLLAEDKAALVDRRNFYEADTLRRVKSTDPVSEGSPNVFNSRNLFPHGLKDKSGSQTQLNAENPPGNEFPSTAQTSHRRSRSLEGLLDDAGLQILVEQRNRANRQQQQQQQQEQVVLPQQALPQQETATVNRGAEADARPSANENQSFQVEDPWEQDSLWRESLRRVSLRHARSLDNLDTPTSARSASAESQSRARGKITRGATYVNDIVVNSMERLRARRRSDESSAGNENGNGAPNAPSEQDDAYESLAMDRVGAGGYIWDPENEAYRKPESGQHSQNSRHFLAEGNPAPVVIRNQHQQQQQQHQQQSQQVAMTGVAGGRSSFELDREKLRQWDLLSSACSFQELQRTSMALGDGCSPGQGLPAATASLAAVTGCASVADASPRQQPKSKATKTTTKTTGLAENEIATAKLQQQQRRSHHHHHQQQQQQQRRIEDDDEEEMKKFVAAAVGRSNGAGEWLYRTGAGIAYKK